MSQTYNAVLQAQLQNRSKAPDYLSVSSVRTEIRTRRKHILGSYISVRTLICDSKTISDAYVEDLSRFLAGRTIRLWVNKGADAENFCYRFYVLALYALASGNVGDESIDDIIQLAECLVRSKDIFITVMRNLLPTDMISELFSFVESDECSCVTATFEDAVLGAVAVLLGVLADPVAP